MCVVASDWAACSTITTATPRRNSARARRRGTDGPGSGGLLGIAFPGTGACRLVSAHFENASRMRPVDATRVFLDTTGSPVSGSSPPHEPSVTCLEQPSQRGACHHPFYRVPSCSRERDTRPAPLLLRCYYTQALKFWRETRTAAMQAGLPARRLALRMCSWAR